MDQVFLVYVNSYIEVFYCGSVMIWMCEVVCLEIVCICCVYDSYVMIFCGLGVIVGLNWLVYFLGVFEMVECGEKLLVILGFYEYYFDIFFWREIGVEVVEIIEVKIGGLDLVELEMVLKVMVFGWLVVGVFFLMLNVIGIVIDEDVVIWLLKWYGVFSVWDCVGFGLYLLIDMKLGMDVEKDVVVVLLYKFLGGLVVFGVMIVCKQVVWIDMLVFLGGGIVWFVFLWVYDYLDDIVVCEEVGMLNVIGDIWVVLVFLVKEVIGQELMDGCNVYFWVCVLVIWKDYLVIEIMGNL